MFCGGGDQDYLPLLLLLLAFFHRIVMRTNILYVRRRRPVLCIRGYAVRERGGGDLLFFLGNKEVKKIVSGAGGEKHCRKPNWL